VWRSSRQGVGSTRRCKYSQHLITGSKQFVRGYPYMGWERSIYDNVAFDAYSTEFRLAAIFDKTSGFKA